MIVVSVFESVPAHPMLGKLFFATRNLLCMFRLGTWSELCLKYRVVRSCGSQSTPND